MWWMMELDQSQKGSVTSFTPILRQGRGGADIPMTNLTRTKMELFV